MLQPGLFTPAPHQRVPPSADLLRTAWPDLDDVDVPATDPSRWLAATLDEIDYGLVLVDGQGRLRHANRCARARLDAGDGLRMEGGRVVACESGERTELEAAIHAAATRGLRRLVQLGTGPGAFAVAVIPVPATALGPMGVLLVTSRHHVCEPLSTDWFARAHGLTPTECRVLHALCDGVQPSDIAEMLGVALSTVRTHIGTIRAKTGASSVKELLHRVAQLPPMRHALAV
jgi:DNA-binding CsgD family transcriptional regulator